MEEKPKRIGTIMIVLLFYVAILADITQVILTFIPVVGEILPPIFSFAAGLSFFIWFRLIGVKLSLIKDPKKIAGTAISFVAEYIPIIDALPGWTILVAITVLTTNANVNIPLVTPKVVNKKRLPEISKTLPTSN
ncbi:MAG: hypothetical protein WC095_00910 [Candidatus Paceibacterota bacterium]